LKNEQEKAIDKWRYQSDYGANHRYVQLVRAVEAKAGIPEAIDILTAVEAGLRGVDFAAVKEQPDRSTYAGATPMLESVPAMGFRPVSSVGAGEPSS